MRRAGEKARIGSATCSLEGGRIVLCVYDTLLPSCSLPFASREQR